MSETRTLDDGAFWAGGDAVAELKDLRDEAEHYDDLIARQGALLRGVVNAIKGPPPDDTLWSHHDAPELAEGVMAELEALRADAARLDWYFGQTPKDGAFLSTYMLGMREGWTPDQWRAVIDEARKGAA